MLNKKSLEKTILTRKEVNEIIKNIGKEICLHVLKESSRISSAHKINTSKLEIDIFFYAIKVLLQATKKCIGATDFNKVLNYLNKEIDSVRKEIFDEC